MRELRFARPGPAGDTVVLETPDGHEQFTLSIDSALRDAVRSDLPRLSPRVAEALTPPAPAEPAPAPAPVAAPALSMARSAETIGPREIQMRVRAGETPEAIAEDHGASLEWVQRFAVPVLAERERIADEARRARARRSTAEANVVVFGEAVDERFAAHGIDPTTVRWDARRREDGQWVVSAQWLGGSGEFDAEWTFQLSSRSVTPIDDTATDLLSDKPIRPVAPPPPPVDRGPTSLSLAPPLTPGVVAFPAMPDAHTGPLPAVESPDELFDQEAADDGLDVLGPVPSDEVPYDMAPLPLHVAGVPDEPVVARSNGTHGHRGTARLPRVRETEEEKAARATIPSWDDILLGVRRKKD